MYVEVKKKWVVDAERYVVIFSFKDVNEATLLMKPYLSTNNPPAFADLTGGGDITVEHHIEIDR